jgi:ubiquinone/menaquinone biosynthesis C-methylase UbiE
VNVNIGCGTHYAPGWCNVDLEQNQNTRPDLVARATTLPFPDGSVDRLYAGHVMEHVAWPSVPAVLAELRRIADGEVLFTGPDVYRTVRWWKEGRVSWELVESVLESQDNGQPHWPEAVHHWNCHQARLAAAVEGAGFCVSEPPIDRDGWDGWPVVNWSGWQCAVLARPS